MKPKERVIAAVNFKEPDRIPMDFSCNPEVQEKLYKYFNIKAKKNISNPLVTYVDPQILERLNCDFRFIVPPYTGTDDRTLNLFGLIVSYECPLKNAATEEVEKYPWPSPDWFDYESVATQCIEYKDYAIVSGCPGNGDFLHKAGRLYGIEDVYRGLARKDPVLIKIFEKISDFFYEYNRRIFHGGRGMIDIAFYGDDYGGQYGPLIGENTYRDIFQPLWKKHYSLARSYNLKVMHHSCGAISGLLPAMYEMGVNIIDPLQLDVKGMTPEKLKEKFHEKLAFHGGINLGRNIPYKNASEVRKEVRRISSIFSPGGGYIMAPTTMVTEDIPIEHILAVYEEGNANSEG